MAARGPLRLYFHGSIILVVSMLMGIPAFSGLNWVTGEPRAALVEAHIILIPTGIWMLAVGAIMAQLELEDRYKSALVWCLIVSAYALIVSIPAGLFGLARGLNSSQLRHDPLYVAALAVNGLTALAAAIIVIKGARAALWQRVDHPASWR
jgi:lysylphosphatidylglycerol synthetase-like protein (DUF2156 family)